MAAMQQTPSAKSLEQIRTNARRRLIGAIILVVLAIAILPWILENKPRESQTEVPVNTAVTTAPPAVVTPSQSFPPMVPPAESGPPALPLPQPDQGGGDIPPVPSSPSGLPTTVSPDHPFFVVEGTVPGNASPDAAYTIDPLGGAPDIGVSEGSHAQQTNEGYAIRPANRQTIASKLKPGEVAPTTASANDGARAAALLGEPAPAATRPPATGNGAQTAAASQKFVIQVGAYSDAAKVNEVQAKLTMAGFTSYTEEASTNIGRVTRVRIGPVNGRANADEMARKIGALGLPVSILPA